MPIYNVTNVETKEIKSNRYITYDLKKELPPEWDKWSFDDQSAWLNNNAEFIRDEFEETDEEVTDEVGIDVELDELNKDI